MSMGYRERFSNGRRECYQKKFPKRDVTDFRGGQVFLDRAKSVGARSLSKVLTVSMDLCSGRGVNTKYLLNSYVLGTVPNTLSALF